MRLARAPDAIEATALDAPSQQPERPALSGRVILLFLVLTVIIVLWVEYSVLVVDSTSFNSLAPSITSVFALLTVCLLLNPLLKLLRRSFGLSPRELVLLYSMLMVASPVMSIGCVHFLLPTMTSARYFATPENKWEELFFEFIPSWLGPTDQRDVLDFWESSPRAVPWLLWLRPIALWSVFVLAMYLAMYGLNSIIRRQWIDRERLTFPLVYLPLEMAREDPGRLLSSFYKNWLMWTGFALAVVLQSFPGLHTYYPAWPDLKVKHYPLTPFMREPPWNAVGSFALSFYPCMIGFAYILTTEVSFSGWFFYLFSKAERIFGRAIGWTGVAGSGFGHFPFEEYQSAGAWIALVLFALWIARPHLLQVLRSALGWLREENEADAPLTHRGGVVAALGGIAVMLLWLSAAGLHAGVAAILLVIFFIFILALTRIRAEAGLGCLSGPLTTADLMIGWAGSGPFGARNLTLMAFCHWFTVEFRGAGTVMPCQLEAMKMADASRIRGRHLTPALALAVVVTMFLAFAVTLKVCYLHGGVTLNRWRFLDVPVTPFRVLGNRLSSPAPPDIYGTAFTLVGAGTMLFLTLMRIKYLWWPFHPIGYAYAFTKRSAHWLWTPLLISWIIKTTVIRYGGFQLYRTLLPFFLGLILGDFFIGGVFGVAGALIPQKGYCVFP